MKHLFTVLSMVCIVSTAMLMQGCEADVDLNKIDTSVAVKANVATPIGSLKASIGDFVGDGRWGIYIDSINHDGVLTFRDTFGIETGFEQIDLSQHINSTRMTLNLYDKIGGSIGGVSQQVPLTFPVSLKFKGVNGAQEGIRLDSVLVKNACFVSKLTPSNSFPIKWEWIDKIELDLGSNFHRANGNIITIHEKNTSNNGYGQDIAIDIDEFSLNLMRNKNPQTPGEYKNNTIDSCIVNVTMLVTIPSSVGVISVPSTAAVQYELSVRIIECEAIWGMIKPTKEMSVNAEDAIADYWPAWNTILKLCLPIAKPRVDVSIETQVAGAIDLMIDHLYTQNDQGESKYATFSGNKDIKYTMNLPLDSPLDAVSTLNLTFSDNEAQGNLDELFSIRPDKVGYKFSVAFDEEETPQLRITKDTKVRVNAACDVPMIFNEGMSLAYEGTIDDIDLSMLTIDDILDSISVLDTLKDASAKLVITLENAIPLDLKGKFTCLDKNNNVIIDPETNQPLLITQNETIVIKAPEHTLSGEEWTATPRQNVEVIDVDVEKLETLKKIKRIQFSAELTDESMQNAYNQGLFNAKLTDSNYIRVKLALGANVEAVLNFDSVINQ